MKNKTVELSAFIYYISIFLYCFGTMLSSSMLCQMSAVKVLITLLRFVSVIGSISAFLFRIKYKKKYWVIVIALTISLVLSSLLTGDHGALLMVLILISAWGRDGRKIAKTYLAGTGSVVLISWLLAKAGVIEDRVFQFWRTSQGPLMRHSYGLTYTTLFSATIFFLIATVFYLFYGKLRKFYSKALLIMLSLVILYFTYQGTEGRLEFGMGILFLILFIFSPLWIKICRSQWFAKFFEMIPLICMAISVIPSLLYAQNPTRYEILNWFMTGRLSMSAQAIRQYGFNLFGHTITMVGGGALETIDAEDYFFIDAFYLNWAIVYGVVVIVFVLILFFWINKNVLQIKDYSLILCLVLVYLHGVIISSLMHPEINPFFSIAIAEISQYYKQEKYVDKSFGKYKLN